LLKEFFDALNESILIVREQSFRLDDSDEDLMPEDIVRNDKSVEKDEWDLSNLE
jgi:hypothetical protein